jgi:hypothetical protein
MPVRRNLSTLIQPSEPFFDKPSLLINTSSWFRFMVLWVSSSAGVHIDGIPSVSSLSSLSTCFPEGTESHRLFPMAGVYLLILHLDEQCALTSSYGIQIHSLGKNSSHRHDFWSLRAIGVLKGSFFNFPTDH